MQGFKNRREAGKLLSEKLRRYSNESDTVILALPRGGVPVAYEVTKGLNISMEIFIVRKLGIPGQEEVAMGAIATGGIRVLNEEIIEMINIPSSIIEKVTNEELKELVRREKKYRGNKPKPIIAGKSVIIIDDGLATGSTMRAAIQAVKSQSPATITIAVPVSDYDIYLNFKKMVDDIVCVLTPEHLGAVGRWYEDFSQTSDIEVIDLLTKARLFDPNEIWRINNHK